jgi:hypothetical protein
LSKADVEHARSTFKLIDVDPGPRLWLPATVDELVAAIAVTAGATAGERC